MSSNRPPVRLSKKTPQTLNNIPNLNNKKVADTADTADKEKQEQAQAEAERKRLEAAKAAAEKAAAEKAAETQRLEKERLEKERLKKAEAERQRLATHQNLKDKLATSTEAKGASTKLEEEIKIKMTTIGQTVNSDNKFNIEQLDNDKFKEAAEIYNEADGDEKNTNNEKVYQAMDYIAKNTSNVKTDFKTLIDKYRTVCENEKDFEINKTVVKSSAPTSAPIAESAPAVVSTPKPTPASTVVSASPPSNNNEPKRIRQTRTRETKLNLTLNSNNEETTPRARKTRKKPVQNTQAIINNLETRSKEIEQNYIRMAHQRKKTSITKKQTEIDKKQRELNQLTQNLINREGKNNIYISNNEDNNGHSVTKTNLRTKKQKLNNIKGILKAKREEAERDEAERVKAEREAAERVEAERKEAERVKAERVKEESEKAKLLIIKLMKKIMTQSEKLEGTNSDIKEEMESFEALTETERSVERESHEEFIRPLLEEKESYVIKGKTLYAELKNQEKIVQAHETTYQIDIGSIPEEFKSESSA